MTKETVIEVDQKDLLDNFSWESENIFFGIEPVDKVEEEKKVIEEVKKPAPTETVKKPEKEEEKNKETELEKAVKNNETDIKTNVEEIKQ